MNDWPAAIPRASEKGLVATSDANGNLVWQAAGSLTPKVALPGVTQRVATRTRVRNDLTNPRAVGLTGWGHAETVTVSSAALTAVTNDPDLGFCANYTAVVTGGTPAGQMVLVPIGGYAPCLGGQPAFVRLSVKMTAQGSAAAVLAQMQTNPLQSNQSTSAGNGRVLATVNALVLNAVSVFEGVWYPDTNGVTSMAYLELLMLLTIPANGTWTFRIGKPQITVDPDGRCPSYIDGSMALGSWLGTTDASPSEGWADHQPPCFWGFNDPGLELYTYDPTTHAPISQEQTVAMNQEIGAIIRRGGPIPTLSSSAVWPSSAGSPDWNKYPLAPLWDELAAAGIQIMAGCSGVLPWMTTDGSTSLLALDPTKQAAWIQLYQAMVLRFPNITALEFYNEPNLAAVWGPYPSPSAYTPLMIAMYDGIHSVAPSVLRIGGSLAHYFATDPGFPAAGLNMGTKDYLTQMYTNGAKGHMDAIGVHPYPSDISTAPPLTRTNNFYCGFDEIMTQVRAARATAGDTVPIWITEIGVSLPQGNYSQTNVSERQQAQIANLLMGICERNTDIIACLWNFMQAPSAPGLVDWGLAEYGSLRRRPGWEALRTAEVPRYLDPVYAVQDDAEVLLETMAPQQVAAAGFALSTGVVFLYKVMVPRTITPQKMAVDVSNAGASLSAGANLLGIYSSTGKLLAQTGDMTTAWASAAVTVGTLTAQVTIQGGPGRWVWLAILSKGTTLPKFYGASGGQPNALESLDALEALVPGTRITTAFETAGGRSALPSQLGGLSSTALVPWIAVY